MWRVSRCVADRVFVLKARLCGAKGLGVYLQCPALMCVHTLVYMYRIVWKLAGLYFEYVQFAV